MKGLIESGLHLVVGSRDGRRGTKDGWTSNRTPISTMVAMRQHGKGQFQRCDGHEPPETRRKEQTMSSVSDEQLQRQFDEQKTMMMLKLLKKLS